MKKNELKKILRPLIKECIKEILFEEGTLSTIISEVVKGTSKQNVVYESKRPVITESENKSTKRRQIQLKEQKKKMLDAIGRDAYNGVDLFEGTTPAPTPRGTNPHGSKALEGVAPNDPGVDISSFGSNGIWKKLAGN
jgi:hypothetical protein